VIVRLLFARQVIKTNGINEDNVSVGMAHMPPTSQRLSDSGAQVTGSQFVDRTDASCSMLFTLDGSVPTRSEPRTLTELLR